jgi:hypothetical protein
VPVRRATLRAALHDLFSNRNGLDVTFYFAEHGFASDTGGNLVTADGVANDYGITMDELYIAAQRSLANSALLLLECCHAGAVGNVQALGDDAGTRSTARPRTSSVTSRSLRYTT